MHLNAIVPTVGFERILRELELSDWLGLRRVSRLLSRFVDLELRRLRSFNFNHAISRCQAVPIWHQERRLGVPHRSLRFYRDVETFARKINLGHKELIGEFSASDLTNFPDIPAAGVVSVLNYEDAELFLQTHPRLRKVHFEFNDTSGETEQILDGSGTRQLNALYLTCNFSTVSFAWTRTMENLTVLVVDGIGEEPSNLLLSLRFCPNLEELKLPRPKRPRIGIPAAVLSEAAGVLSALPRLRLLNLTNTSPVCCRPHPLSESGVCHEKCVLGFGLSAVLARPDSALRTLIIPRKMLYPVHCTFREAEFGYFWRLVRDMEGRQWRIRSERSHEQRNYLENPAHLFRLSQSRNILVSADV